LKIRDGNVELGMNLCRGGSPSSESPLSRCGGSMLSSWCSRIVALRPVTIALWWSCCLQHHQGLTMDEGERWRRRERRNSVV